jgi:general secretion pathway protein G
LNHPTPMVAGARKENACCYRYVSSAVNRRKRDQAGVTIVELLVVTAIVAVLSAVALPVARFGMRRQKELQLRERLQLITAAIDRYSDLRSRGLVKAQAALLQGTYPKTLDELTKPVELLDGKKLLLLSPRNLIDPMTGRAEWLTVSMTDDPGTTSTNGDNVFDLHSTSTALALDGKTHYNEW